MMNKTIRILRAPVLQACCRRGARIRRAAMLLLATLLLTMTAQTAWADSYPAYITDVMVIGGDASTVESKWATYRSQGYVKVDFDLNSDAGGDYVYVLYKTGSRNSTDGGYITDLVVSTTDASSVTYNGTTYTRVAHDGSDHFKKYGGNLNSSAKSGSTNMWLFYTKKNFSNKRAVNDIVVNTSSSKSGYTTIGKNGGSDAYDLNEGAGGDYVYMHFSTTTKTNRPASDPTMKTELVYTGQTLQLVNYNPTSQCTMYYRVGTSGSYTSDVSSITATNAGTYTVYYYAASNSYGNSGPTFSQTVTISKAANSGVTVSCDDVMEGNAPQPTLGGTNLSTGAVTYRYSTSQSGSYTTTVPTTAGTYWVKATIASDANCNEYTTAAASFTMTPDWELHNSGSSEADAYVINTTGDLDLLAQRVNDGNNYSGKYFRLGADITYDGTENNYNRIGLQDKPFSGHFDGKGHSISGININKDASASGNFLGLFGFIDNGASVKNIRLFNVAIRGLKYCGGIAGDNGGVIENCSVSSDVHITANETYSERIGGIAGHNSGTVSGCKSSTTINTYGDANQYLGGIVGRNDGTLRNNVVAGAQITGSYKFSGIICSNKGTLTCNYYLDSSGSDTNGARRGVRINAADGVTITPTGTATTYDVSGITAYEGNNGILYNVQLYAGATEQVRLNVSYDNAPADYQLNGFTDGNGNALADNGDGSYTLTMTGEAATVTPEGTSLWGTADGADGSQQHPYVITTTAGLDLLAQKVNAGTSYSNRYFELGADITYDGTTNNYTPISTESNTFKGHFDGKGHTVSGINVNLPSTDYVGLFASVSYATIQNLTLANSTICGGKYVGGIVGSGGSTNTTIQNCHVGSDVTVSGTHYVGGIVGHYATVRGCTGAATVTVTGNIVGGITGTANYSVIENCLVYGGTVKGTNAGAIAGTNNNSTGTLTNNRYTGGVTLNGSEARLNAGVGDNGSQDGTCYICAIIPYEGVTLSIPSVSATTEYPYDGLKIYPTGMTYKGQYYNYYTNADAGISGDVTFTATYSGSVPEDHALGGFGSTSIADNKNVEMEWEATDGSATCTLCTGYAAIYYIAPTFRNAIWGDGDGTQGNPYIITNVRGMNELASRVNSGEGLGGKYFELGADITYDGTENNYTPIGTSDHPFSANFDGKGYTISGINITNKNSYANPIAGIFGYAKYCTIQNITLANSTFSKTGDTGGIFSSSERVTVSNCHVTNTVTLDDMLGQSFSGGIGGYAEYSAIQGCTNEATMTYRYLESGGIMGCMRGGTIKDCLYLGPKINAEWNSFILYVTMNATPTISNSYYISYGKTPRYGGVFAVATTDKPEGASATATATYGTGSYTGITVFGNVLYYDGKYYWHDENLMELADRNENNSSIIAGNDRQTRNVVLKDRTLYKDGSWNTLCLPFAVDLTASGTLSGDGVQAMTLNTATSSLADGTLTLNFTAAETIPAGTPFIIKWDESGTDIENPVFKGVTIDAEKHDATVTGVLTFTGTYAPVTIPDGGDKTKLYLGSGNTLYYPNAAMTIGTHRAYFQLLGDLTAGNPASLVRAFVLNFGDDGSAGDPTRIHTIDAGEGARAPHGWYTLDGRRLDGQPTAKGLYIHGGKKVVIK